MIIDTHEHIGDSKVFNFNATEEDLMTAMNENKVDKALVLPVPGVDEPACHDDIAALAKKYPKRIYGVVSLNPHISKKDYYHEVERCVKGYGFVGLKLHPFGHYCIISSPDTDKVFEAAQDFNIPLIIHTGLGAPYALPSLIIPRARQFPRIKIIAAHSGGYFYTPEVFVVAEICPNVYLETSWCAPHRIREMIDKFGAERVMFGADLPIAIASDLAKYRSIKLSSSQLEQCLSGTAREVFRIP